MLFLQKKKKFWYEYYAWKFLHPKYLRKFKLILQRFENKQQKTYHPGAVIKEIKILFFLSFKPFNINYHHIIFLNVHSENKIYNKKVF